MSVPFILLSQTLGRYSQIYWAEPYLSCYILGQTVLFSPIVALDMLFDLGIDRVSGYVWSFGVVEQAWKSIGRSRTTHVVTHLIWRWYSDGNVKRDLIFQMGVKSGEWMSRNDRAICLAKRWFDETHQPFGIVTRYKHVDCRKLLLFFTSYKSQLEDRENIECFSP